MLSKRERLAARYVADVVAGKGDARRMSKVTQRTFTPEERLELVTMARAALNRAWATPLIQEGAHAAVRLAMARKAA